MARPRGFCRYLLERHAKHPDRHHLRPDAVDAVDAVDSVSAPGGPARLRAAFDDLVELDQRSREAAIARWAQGDEAFARELGALLDAANTSASALDTPLLRLEPAAVSAEVPGYRLLQALGEGGSAAVHLAEQEHDGFTRRVALKILRAQFDPAFDRRVRDERRILAALEHPGIARLYDTGLTAAGHPYLAMELVEGLNLVEFCRRGELDLRARLGVFLAALDAVDYAHRNLIVHRDLKPANILVSGAGEVKLVDFGIAKMLESADEEPTRTEYRALTLAYASPEQVRGERLTTATDIYSLGVVLYELLAGVRPYRLDDPRWTLKRAICEQEVERPSTATARPGSHAPTAIKGDRRQARRELAGDLDAIVLKAMRKEPAARYGSVTQFAEDLRHFLAGQPVSARRGTARYRIGKFAGRHRAALAGGGLVLALAAAGLVVYYRDLARERDLAATAAAEARQQAAKAERVVELLSQIFREATPMQQPGRPLTGTEVLERGSAQVERQLAGEPAVRGEMLAVLARLWCELGQTERAAALAEASVAELEGRLGASDPATAKAWSALALVRRRQGRPDEALALFERAIAVQRARAGDFPHALASSLGDYGGLLRTVGRFEEARQALAESIAIYARATGPDSAEVGRVTGNLGLVLERLEDWTGAEERHQRAFEILSREYGAGSPRAAVALGNLAGLWTRRGEHQRAIDALRRVDAIYRQALGPDYSARSVTLNSLAFALLDAKRYAEARVQFEAAIAAGLDPAGAPSTLAAWPMRGLGQLEEATGDYAAAAREYERARALRVEVVGPSHWEVAQSLTDLAEVAGLRGDTVAEERYRRAAVEVRRQAHPEPHPELARALAALGTLLCGTARGGEGASLMTEACQLAAKIPGLNAPEREEWQRVRERCAAPVGPAS